MDGFPSSVVVEAYASCLLYSAAACVALRCVAAVPPFLSSILLLRRAGRGGAGSTIISAVAVAVVPFRASSSVVRASATGTCVCVRGRSIDSSHARTCARALQRDNLICLCCAQPLPLVPCPAPFWPPLSGCQPQLPNPPAPITPLIDPCLHCTACTFSCMYVCARFVLVLLSLSGRPTRKLGELIIIFAGGAPFWNLDGWRNLYPPSPNNHRNFVRFTRSQVSFAVQPARDGIGEHFWVENMYIYLSIYLSIYPSRLHRAYETMPPHLTSPHLPLYLFPRRRFNALR